VPSRDVFWKTVRKSDFALPLDWVGKYSAENFLPVSRCVLKTPELWGGDLEAKANFGSAAFLLT